MAQDIFFQGIASPARLDGVDRLVDLLPDLAFGWPYRVTPADPALQPFFSISTIPDSDRLLCQNHLNDGATRKLDDLNALCDLFAALAIALPNHDPRLICLHAAAVTVGGQLLIFPNVRMAGKSTLSAALAFAGHGLLGDDVVPLSFDEAGQAMAEGMGISPRLRLPLPTETPPGFQDWVAATGGATNRQYRYLRIPNQPGREARFPVGAFVILDRKDDPVPARIEPILPDQAMDVLLFQNFTRDRHSGDVLARIARLLTSRPAYRLTYCDLDGAVKCLEAAFPPTDPVVQVQGAPEPFRLADFQPRPTPVIAEGVGVGQRPGTEVQMIGETLYLADPEGRAIHRMDPLATAIWGLIAEPCTPPDLQKILTEAFPSTDAQQIADDLATLLGQWATAGLIDCDPAA